MKYHAFLIIISFLGFSFNTLAQKKIINHEVYNSWKRIGQTTLSPNGKYAAFTIKPYKGDGYLYLVNLETGKKDSVFKGQNPKFDSKSELLYFTIHPGFDTLRNLEIKKIKKDKWPNDSLAIWYLKNDSLVIKNQLKDFLLAENGQIFATISPSNDWHKNYLTKKEVKKEQKFEKKHGKIKTDGKLLSIYIPGRKSPLCVKNVKEALISKSGKYVAYLEHEKNKQDSVRLCVYNSQTNKIWRDTKRYTSIKSLTFSGKLEYLLGISSTDSTAEKRWNLIQFNGENEELTKLIDTNYRSSSKWVLSPNFKPYYNNNDSDLFFGLMKQPTIIQKDTLPESEKATVDLWHWKDLKIQPQQVVELKRDQLHSNLAVLHLNSKEIVELGNDTLKLKITSKENQKLILASSNEAFVGANWEMPQASNYYLISTENGKIIPLDENQIESPALSPKQTKVVRWNRISKNYYIQDIQTEVEKCITCGLNVNLLADINGMPMEAEPRGVIGWGPNDESVFIQSEFDIIIHDVKSGKSYLFTEQFKKSEKDSSFNYQLYNLEIDSLSFHPENCLLVKFDKRTKAEEVYRIKGNFLNPQFELISGSNHAYANFIKSKHSDRITMTRASNSDYPDVFSTKKPGDPIQRLSWANPQQSEYIWSTVELIRWKSYTDIPLEGLIYKPENFDPNKEYPLLVYFYEMYSDELHNHYAPRPTASIIFPTEYASAGYVVFIPNIRYKPGHPANSAYDCILSGIDTVLHTYPNIDPKKMGLQGQSWGGYQTAQLITMTDRFAAAMAGAPVSNMFSAYGGIRWGSGMSRQFQYEHTQSRIGKTIWEAPELYVENSPLFGLPKVKTPLLIMHNDHDGAVPWYQGIELYMGLRRLQKPVWLLNYNGDDHNLMKPANRLDLSIRMRQFFDYYLLGKAQPLWLKEGIPALEKGRNTKLNLVE